MIVTFSAQTESLRLVLTILLTDARKHSERLFQFLLVTLLGLVRVLRDTFDLLFHDLQLLLGLEIMSSRLTYILIARKIVEIPDLTLFRNVLLFASSGLVHYNNCN